MLREWIPMLSAMTLDQLGAKMRCDKCGKRPERYYPQSDMPGFVQRNRCPSRPFDEPIQPRNNNAARRGNYILHAGIGMMPAFNHSKALFFHMRWRND